MFFGFCGFTLKVKSFCLRLRIVSFFSQSLLQLHPERSTLPSVEGAALVLTGAVFGVWGGYCPPSRTVG